MPMQRSTRFRRLAVALLVVLVLAVAARLARAASPRDTTPAPSRTLLGTAPFAASMDLENVDGG